MNWYSLDPGLLSQLKGGFSEGGRKTNKNMKLIFSDKWPLESISLWADSCMSQMLFMWKTARPDTLYMKGSGENSKSSFLLECVCV